MAPSVRTRRDFLKVSGWTAASLAMPRRHDAAEPSAVGQRFFSEISASLYAWELHDEGIERILDNLQKMAAVNSVYLIALMHKEKRPLTSDSFPHNPVRKTWNAEDSRVYWRPDLTKYGRIKPRLSDYDWLNQTDWLKVMIEAARKRGFKTGVEVSHTVLDGERAEKEFPDCMQRNIRGQPVVNWGRAYPICLNSPDAREYVCGLFSDLAANYDVDYIQTCMIPFYDGGASLARPLELAARGGCFCDSCKRAAKETGFDLEKALAVLRPLAGSVQQSTTEKPDREARPEPPELSSWLAFRRDSVTRFYKDIHDRIHAIRPKVDLRLNVFIRHAEVGGMDLRALKPHLDSIRVCDYSEQTGNLAALTGKRQWLHDVREAAGKEMPVLSAVAVRPKATPEIIREGVKVAVECGVNGITLGHYDGAEFPMLRAVREGLALANVQVAASFGGEKTR
jgi:hypothetical protein